MLFEHMVGSIRASNVGQRCDCVPATGLRLPRHESRPPCSRGGRLQNGLQAAAIHAVAFDPHLARLHRLRNA